MSPKYVHPLSFLYLFSSDSIADIVAVFMRFMELIDSSAWQSRPADHDAAKLKAHTAALMAKYVSLYDAIGD